MKPSQIAAALGRRGGRARARRLPADERRRIASMGGTARARSLEAARRIAQNFQYLAVLDEIRPTGPPRVSRQRKCSGPLPGTSLRKP